MGLAARLVPALRVRMKAAERALTAGLPAKQLVAWDERWRDEFEQRTQALLAEDLAPLAVAPWTLLFKTPALTGLRRGELLGLR